MSAATCRECGQGFERAPGTPRVCDRCLPAFKARLVREGTPQACFAYPEAALGDDAGVRKVKKAARALARLTVDSPSLERGRKRPSDLTRDEHRAAVAKAEAALVEALRDEHTGRLRYWAGATMIDSRFQGASGQGGIWAAASRLVNERAAAELRRRGDAWRAAGLGSFATVEAVEAAGLS